MKKVFFPKLAWEGIRKNKKMYAPYLLTGCVMVMVSYILRFVADSPAVQSMRGGRSMVMVLVLGAGVMAVFSVLFLFYTNSFIIRQRYPEFGLYNILGMDKRNIGKLMLWEGSMVAGIVIGVGSFLGIVFAKAAELVLFNLVHVEVTYDLRLNGDALWKTVITYGLIYLLLLVNSFVRVRRAKPLELMQSNRAGERTPKRTWLYAAVGMLFLGTAYYLAVSIKTPLTAMNTFFLAVLMVIIATYLLFMAGSVALCRILQKNKRYYYTSKHFVSVSSMAYRMRRNGAGLASICILLTMVLVMISSSASLYFGVEDAINGRYPAGVNLSVRLKRAGASAQDFIEQLWGQVESNIEIDSEPVRYLMGEVPVKFVENGVVSQGVNDDTFIGSDIGYLSVVPLSDYNRISGGTESLNGEECLIYTVGREYGSDTFSVNNGNPYRVKKVLERFFLEDEAALFPVIYVVTDDFETFTEAFMADAEAAESEVMMFYWHCGFDMDTPEEEIVACDRLYEVIGEQQSRYSSSDESEMLYYSVESREMNREEFIQMYGGLFFLGMMLSIVFLLAAVLIIYYKQISEGYEDRARFDIMQKVGMTKRDIRKSINSQVLTVFFSPLVFAGIHLGFAFPYVWKILNLFELYNMPLVIWANVICFVAFGVFYAMVYKVTSNTYYSIVNGKKTA